MKRKGLLHRELRLKYLEVLPTVGYFGAVQNALTIAEASTRLAIGRDTAERLIRSGDLIAVDVSPRAGQLRHRPLWRIREADLETFINSRVTHAQIPVQPRRTRTPAQEFIR